MKRMRSKSVSAETSQQPRKVRREAIEKILKEDAVVNTKIIDDDLLKTSCTSDPAASDDEIVFIDIS